MQRIQRYKCKNCGWVVTTKWRVCQKCKAVREPRWGHPGDEIAEIWEPIPKEEDLTTYLEEGL